MARNHRDAAEAETQDAKSLTARVPQSLIQVSHSVGAVRPQWIQGAGGNISIKHQGVLWIKASGARLSDMTDSAGWAAQKVLAWEKFWKSEDSGHLHSEEEYSQFLAANKLTSARPSMETAFHSCFLDTWVLHFHSLPAILMADDVLERGNAERIKDLFVSLGLTFSVVSEELPGLQLARKLKQCPSSTFYLIQNHGLVAKGEDSEQILRTWKILEESYLKSLKIDFALGTRDQLSSLDRIYDYFPDVPIYRTKLEDLWSQRAQKEWLERPQVQDELEVLQAIAWLKNRRHDLRELSAEVVSQITSLPTEKVRLQRLGVPRRV